MITNLKLLLEHLLSEDIDEARVQISQAKSEKLALAISKGDDEVVDILLYKPSYILNAFESNPNIVRNSYSTMTIKDTIGRCAPAVVGTISYSSYSEYEEGLYETKHSAVSEHGYGPLMYDIALSAIYPGFLMADRKNVSKSARIIWEYYFNNRTDVNKVFMPSRMADSSNSTDYKYQIKQPENFISLTNNHLKFSSIIAKNYKFKRSDLEDELANLSGEFFKSKYS
jgi:hypothetical protein